MANKKRTLFVIAAGVLGGAYAIYKGINKDPRKYSLEWMKSLSDDELKIEHENLHQKYLDPQCIDDYDYRESLRNIMASIQEVLAARYWAGRTPQGPSYSREHGRNLYKPD